MNNEQIKYVKGYKVGDVVTMKKQHPCGENNWIIKRVGVDFKLECIGCKHIIMLKREVFLKNVKNKK